MFNLTERTMLGRHLFGSRGRDLIARRSRRLQAEAAEVAEIDQWLATMRSGPEMVLYSAHPKGPRIRARRAKKSGSGRRR